MTDEGETGGPMPFGEARQPPPPPPGPVGPVGPTEVPPPASGPRHGADKNGSAWQRFVERRQTKKAEKARKPHRKAPWWELPALIVLAILIAIVVKTFVVQPFYIPSESMEKTLHGCQGCHGDRILVNKVIFDFRDPHPGDIVVFNAPPGWDDEVTRKPPSNPIVKGIRGFGQLIGFVPPDGQVLVKRVIATGGQTVKGDTQGNVMVSNSGPDGPYRTLDEPYVFIDKGQQSNIRSFGPVTVPKGRLWVMGDHRNDSADSRYHCGPGGADATDDSSCDPTPSTVPVDDVIGKAFVIAWPPSRWRTLGTPSTFETAALAGASDMPALVSAGVVLPVFALRRRRRRAESTG
jgi:signal peptidase I